ncbi:RebB family R body protein [Roseibium sp.]|uniref:RebB family R body protein n=1 Tax=Roseibium sp. TaxID=1936156 RepID=UPI003A97788F
MSASKTSAPAADVDALVLGLSPAVATSALYASLVHSMGALFENSVAAQKRQTLMGDVALLEGILQNLTASAMNLADDKAMLDPAEELAAILKALKTAH